MWTDSFCVEKVLSCPGDANAEELRGCLRPLTYIRERNCTACKHYCIGILNRNPVVNISFLLPFLDTVNVNVNINDAFVFVFNYYF